MPCWRAGEWIQAVPPIDAETPASPYHWRHPGLEDLLGRPASQRVDLRPLLADKDPVVAGNAAIGLARFGDSCGAERLAATVRAAELRLAMRAAAVEALACLSGPEVLPLLRELTDQYGVRKRPAPARPRRRSLTHPCRRPPFPPTSPSCTPNWSAAWPATSMPQTNLG